MFHKAFHHVKSILLSYHVYQYELPIIFMDKMAYKSFKDSAV